MRKVDIAVVSDLHLGTYGCHAKEFCDYLESIDTEILVLNGDIIDMWQFKKSFFPADHWDAINAILKKIREGVQIYYVTGNHDDHLRKFSDMALANFHIVNKLLLKVHGKKLWIFHGDVFDNSINCSKWIARFGGQAYDWLIKINRWVNIWRLKLNYAPTSFSHRIKANVKKAVKYISDFENVAIDLAIRNKYDTVICGHIHQPKIKKVHREGVEISYLNSGDWVEHLSALEYSNGVWTIYDHRRVSNNSEKDMYKATKVAV